MAFKDDQEMLDVLFQQVRLGIYNVQWDETTGLPQFSLTRKGRKEAEALIEKLIKRSDREE